MKAGWILRTLVVGTFSIPAMAQADQAQNSAGGDALAIAPFAQSPDRSAAPLDSQAVLNMYDQQMALATVQTYAELAQIAQAVHAGQLSSDQAQHLTRRCYELGVLRIQFLDTLHQITQSSVPKQKVEEPASGVQVSGETLMVAPPSASPDFPVPFARYLELTPAQLAAIQTLAAQAKKQVQPLVQQLSQSETALDRATREPQFDDKRIRKLASEQSHILEQVLIAGSRLQRDIYEILTPEQRKKFEAMAQGAPGAARQLFAGETTPTQ